MARHVPMHVTIELSLKCNERCLHCYNFDRSGALPRDIVNNELTSDEILRLIDEVQTAGTLYLTFTGGEPLLHPDFFKFVARARQRHLAVRLKTNGTLLTSEKAKQLAAAQVSYVEVSLYGTNADTHDSFTRLRGSFERTVAGVRNARDAGLLVHVNFILNQKNKDQLEQLEKLARQLNVEYTVGTELTARHDATVSSRDFGLTTDDLKELYNGPNKNLFKGAINVSDNIQCPCAKNKCAISSTGAVYPCIGAPIKSGDIRKQSFAEIWNHSPQFNWIRKLTIDDFPKCKPCSYRKFCQRSSGSVYVNTGDYTGIEASVCENAKLLKDLNEA
jgi:radical SAM protein with 4Fe4S-binding SPASM domain